MHGKTGEMERKNKSEKKGGGGWMEKLREFGNIAQTQVIVDGQGVNFLILRVENIVIFAAKFSNFPGP